MTATAYADLCKVTTATTGTGTITLGSAVTGFRGTSALTNAAVYAYTIIGSGGAYENGHGTYTSSGTTLTRTVDNSSNANAAVSLAGGETVIVGHVLTSDIALTGSISISPAGLYAKEDTATVAGVLTTSKVICSVSGAMTYPDELELAPAYAFGRCAVNGTLRVRLVSPDKMHATYTVNYQILN